MNNLVLRSEVHPTFNGGINYWDLSYGSAYKLWWICKYSHIWNSRIYSRHNGRGCPKCNLIKTESLGSKNIKNYLKDNNIEYKKEYKLLEYLPKRRYDFKFGKNLGEYDGEQHFKFAKYWHKTEEKFLRDQEIDKFKTFTALSLGYNIFRFANNNYEHICDCLHKLSLIQSDKPILFLDE